MKQKFAFLLEDEKGDMEVGITEEIDVEFEQGEWVVKCEGQVATGRSAYRKLALINYLAARLGFTGGQYELKE